VGATCNTRFAQLMSVLGLYDTWKENRTYSKGSDKLLANSRMIGVVITLTYSGDRSFDHRPICLL
jgi:hypothetical protein